MKYEEHCRKIFKGADLGVEDLYLLESYQIEYLQERAPKRELAAVIHAYPTLGRFFVNKCPKIKDFLEELTSRFAPSSSDEELECFGDSLVWEIADMLVYCKYPELYDDNIELCWDFSDVLEVTSIDNKVVIDGGAGTGRVTFQAEGRAAHVFAVEPNTSLRRFISQKAEKLSIRNVYPIDGFLDAIPLPDNTADVLITSNAIGWRLEEELREMERVVRQAGHIIHISEWLDKIEANPFHKVLISSNWQYQHVSKKNDGRQSIIYFKQVV